MEIYAIIIFGVLIFEALFSVVSNYLNLNSFVPQIPAEFHGLYDAEKYARSQEYLKAKTKENIIQTLVSLLVTLIFIKQGGFAWIQQFAQNTTPNVYLQGALFVSTLAVLASLLSLPFALYDTFVTEEKFGFNRMSLKTFMGDRLKGAILGACLGLPIFALVQFFFESMGDQGWLWVWTSVTALQIFLMFVAPVVIFPLFNKFKPLEDGELKSAIEAFTAQEKFSLQGIYVMDGSKRSSKANAYFAGFGKFRRIVLFDTLLQKHSTEELVAILAHEIGHYKRGHIFKQLAFSILNSFLMFFVMSLFLSSSEISRVFGIETPQVYSGLVLFGFLYAPMSHVVSLISLGMSRKFEFEADAYAAQTYKKPLILATALKKLSVENLSNLTPHWLKVFTEYTHPPVLERVEALKKL